MKPRVFLPAVVSGLLLWAAFFPLDLGPLAFVALVPWLSLVRADGVPRWRRYVAAYAGGLAFFVPALQWVRVAHPAMYASWIGLALYCACYWPLALLLLCRVDRLGRPPLALTLPVVWVALEYCRAHFPTGFPFLKPVGAYQLAGFGWYFLGYTQHRVGQLVQVADLGGVYAVSFVVAAVNGLLAEWLLRSNRVRRLVRWPAEFRPGVYREAWTATGVVALLCGVFGYGVVQTNHKPFADGPWVAAIQGDIGQDVKMNNEETLLGTYDRLCQDTAARADLVVWPETCCPIWWLAVAPGAADVPSDFRAEADKVRDGFRQKLVRDWGGKHVLLGQTCLEWEAGRQWKYNSATLLGPDGRDVARYDKIHLVPFGEYVPFRETLPWLRAFTPYRHDYSCRPGERYTRFPLQVGDRRYTFGCLICYEDSDPYLARQYARPAGEEGPVDFLVNISNDGWFRGTEEHEQHLAVCRFRAVEARKAIIRAVNTGISAVIDPDGRVLMTTKGTWAESKRCEGTVSQRMPLDTRGSVYAALGDWLPHLRG